MASSKGSALQYFARHTGVCSVPQRVREILSGVVAGNRAKLAEAITLGILGIRPCYDKTASQCHRNCKVHII